MPDDIQISVEQNDVIQFDLHQDGGVDDLRVSFDLGPGIKYIYTDEDFTGAGTSQSPLKLSPEFYENLNKKITPFIYTQATASASWVVEHNLHRFPCVIVVDDTNNVMLCSVQYQDEDHVVIEMNKPYTGKAYLN